MYTLKLDTWQEQDLSDEEVQGESRGAFRLREERSGVEVSCVTRGSGGLATHESAVAQFPKISVARFCGGLTLANRRHCVAEEGVEGCGVGLYVGRHNVRVITEVASEGVALPAPFCLDDVEGNSAF